MTRNNNGSIRRLAFESLEQRQMLDATWYSYIPAGSASADELEMWDWVNQFREDPSGMLYKIFNDPQSLYQFDSLYQSHIPVAKDSEVDRALSAYVIKGASGDQLNTLVSHFLSEWYSLEASVPLTLNLSLNSTATSHNASMNKKGTFEHTENLRGTIESTGFAFADSANDPTENIATGGKDARGIFSVSSYLFAEMAIDWGVNSLCHRDNLIDSSVTDLGVAVGQRLNNKGVVQEHFSTLHFAASAEGARTDGAYLLGLIYTDITGDGIYTACKNEGISSSDGYCVTITNSNGESCVLSSRQSGLFQSGGYQVFLQNGIYTVTISGGSFSEEGITREVIIDGDNVKLDFRVQDITTQQPTLDLNGDDEGTGATVRFVEGNTSGTRLVTNNEFIIASGITSGDNANTLSRMTVSFESRPDGANEVLGVTLPENSSIRLSHNTVTGELNVFGTASVEVYRDLIASLTYINLTDGQADLSDRVISIRVSNGVYWSDEAFVTVTIQPKDLPVLTIEDASVWEWENAPDGTAVRTLTFKLTLNAPARQDVTLRYRLSDGTALGGINYRTADSVGTVTIATGDYQATIDVVVYGNYEINNDLEFYLSIDDITGAIWDDHMVSAVIKDDDTPVVRIGGVENWSSDTFGSFERGARHYLYTFTPETDGMARWTVGGTNLTASVSVGWSADRISVGTSQWEGNKETLEWYAEAGVEYYILLTGTFSYRAPKLEFLAVEEDNSIDVDPLVQDGELRLQFADGNLVLGAGDNAFVLPLARLASALSLKTSQNDLLCNIAFGPGESLGFDASSGTLSYDDTSVSLGGFSNYQFGGNNYRESLTLTGSDGNDLLIYGSGAGELVLGYDTETPSTITFDNVTRLNFDAGGGTENVAVLTDSTSRDTIICNSADSLIFTGGGYALTASNFNDVTINSVNGRRDKLSISGVNWSALTAEPGSLLFDTAAPIPNNVQESSGAAATYKYSVNGVQAISVNASGADGTTLVDGTTDEHVRYRATLGYIRAVDESTNSVLEINNAIDIVLTGVDEKQVTLLNTDAASLTRKTTSVDTYTGTTTVGKILKITVPVFATKKIISTADTEPDTNSPTETIGEVVHASEAGVPNQLSEALWPQDNGLAYIEALDTLRAEDIEDVPVYTALGESALDEQLLDELTLDERIIP